MVDGQLRIRVDTPDEAKRAVQELKTMKKELQADRRDIAAQLAAVRADYRSMTAGRHVLPRGGGTTGRIMRGYPGQETWGADER